MIITKVMSWGGLKLFAQQVSTDIGRDVVILSPSTGDRHRARDRGRRLAVTPIELVFCYVGGEEPYQKRYARFLELIETGDPQLFVHPAHGSYLASIGEATATFSPESDSISVQCEFIPDEDYTAVADLGSGASPVAGAESVDAAAAASTAALDQAGLLEHDPETGLAIAPAWISNASSTVSSWTEAESPNPRQVVAETQTLVAAIDAGIDQLELATNLRNWTAFREVIALRSRVVEAGQSNVSETGKTFLFEVRAAAPLRVILRRVYGAAQGNAYYGQVVAMNALREPDLVPAGTILVLPLAGAK